MAVSATFAEFFGGSPQTLSVVDNTFELYQGDSYDGTARPILQWTVTKDYTGWTGTITIRHRVTNDELMSASVTVASSTSLTVSLTTTNTAFSTLLTEDEFGPHPYDIQMTSGSSESTAVYGVATIRRQRTAT